MACGTKLRMDGSGTVASLRNGSETDQRENPLGGQSSGTYTASSPSDRRSGSRLEYTWLTGWWQAAGLAGQGHERKRQRKRNSRVLWE